MRALLFVITMMISVPSFSDVYDEKDKYVGNVSNEYQSNETAALHTAINAVAIIISNKYKYSNDVQESFQKMIDNDAKAIELSQCDKNCRDKVQAEVLKKYKNNKGTGSFLSSK